jgi:molybdenum cofactor biosynthesis enzyme MoaA
MQLNFEKIIKQNLPKNIIQPRRAQAYVGFQCHQKCGFCYYKYKCNEPMFSLDYIKKQIDFEYDYGIRDFEITGGEPSEYNQLREVCQYIKQKNKNSKIAIITNGGLWKSNIWDLIDEVLVSYHLGRNCNYNKEIFPLGCTYDKVKKTIDLAR